MKRLIYTVLACLLLAGCQEQSRQQYYEYAGQLHTSYHIKYEYTEPLDDEIKAELDRFYHLFNVFDSTSVISQINRNENLCVTDTTFVTLFRTAQMVAELTDGAYDVTCAPLINLWGFGFTEGDSTVTQAHIDSVKQFVGYRKIQLTDGKIVKDDPRMMLNCSSIADGTVCDMIADCFDHHGVQNYMVEFGGEIVAKGINPRGEHWRLGINKPKDDSAGVNQTLEAIIHLYPDGLDPKMAHNNGRRGMATSGNYRNFYEKDGKRYAHTIDPREGRPVQRDVLSATIIAPTGGLADACATACMVLGTDGAKLLKEKLPMIDYFLICGDSTGYYTVESPGFAKYKVKAGL